MKKLFFRCLVVILFLSCLGLAYVWAVYRGILLLNHPSQTRYPVRGVDVSHYQGDIDWQTLSGSKLDFAYIKATEGSSFRDKRFKENWEAAAAAPLKSGAYHFFSFDSGGDTQAENFINSVPKEAGRLTPVVDVEYYADKRQNPPDKAAVTQELSVMLSRLEEHYGTRPVLYTTEEVWERYLEHEYETYDIWIRNVISKPEKDMDWTFWQYSNRGKLKGYRGAEEFIDLNVFAGGREEWDTWLKQNTIP